jgi:probable F420-dependent oxidoreductase
MSTQPFRFGLINEQLLEPQRWIAHVQHAEQLGYATFLLRDHLVPDYFGDQYAPLIALASAASATTRLRLGTMVLANDFRHPALLAKEIATLNALSGGRVEIGIGAGWLRNEYEAAGMTYASAGTRIARLEEALTIMRGLWSGESVTFNGAHYQVNGLRCVPLPAQRPGPRIFLGGGHERMLKLAGRCADSVGLLTTSVASGAMVADPTERTPEAVERKLNWVRAGAGARYDAIELSLIPTVLLSDDRVAATERLIGEQGWQGLSVEEVWAMPAVFVGDVSQIAATMRERRAHYGFSYYVFSDHQAEELAPLVAMLAGD